MIDDKFIIRRAAGVFPRGHREGTAGGDGALATPIVFIQLALGEVPVSRSQIVKPQV